MLKPSKIRNLYPIFSVNRYPVGQCKVSVLDQINEIVELNPSTGILQFKDGSTLFGIIKAILLPPEDFSPYFAHNFGTLEKPDRKYCVCFSCANGKGNLKFCRHTKPFDKGIIVTTTVAELNYGLSKKNYKLLQLCELYSYQKGVRLFKDFVQNVEDFKSTLKDPIATKFLKGGLVSSYGYFMLKNREEKTKLCATLPEFQDLLENCDVIDFDPMGDHYLDVCFKNKANSPTNCFSNLILGAHISAYSRMIFDHKVSLLKERLKSMKIYMMNVDAIAFTLNVNENLSGLILDDTKIGAWKSEIKNLQEILSFSALSPHSYNLTYLTKSGVTENISKVCGFSFKSIINSECLNQNLFKKLIIDAVKGQKSKISCLQVRNISNKTENLVEKKILEYQIRNNLFNKRIVNDDFSTLPFGFSKKMENTCK